MGINEYIKIGHKIKKIRMYKGITQREMAKRLNMPVSTYSNYENDNREPSLEVLRKIANALDVSIDVILQHELYDFEKNGLMFIDDDGAVIQGEAAKKPIENISKSDNILPAELNEFLLFIDKLGYRITLDGQQYYLVKGSERKKITVDELRTLVNTSKTVVKGLIDAIINQK